MLVGRGRVDLRVELPGVADQQQRHPGVLGEDAPDQPELVVAGADAEQVAPAGAPVGQQERTEREAAQRDELQQHLVQVPRAGGEVEHRQPGLAGPAHQCPVQRRRARQRCAVGDLGEQRDAQELQSAGQPGLEDRVVDVADQPERHVRRHDEDGRVHGRAVGEVELDVVPTRRQPGVGDDGVDVAVAVAADGDDGAGRAGGDGRVGHLDGQEARQARAQHRAAGAPGGRLHRASDGREHAVGPARAASGPAPRACRAPRAPRAPPAAASRARRTGSAAASAERRNRRSSAICSTRTPSSTSVATRISAARTSAALTLATHMSTAVPTTAAPASIGRLHRTRMWCSLLDHEASRQSCRPAVAGRARA